MDKAPLGYSLGCVRWHQQWVVLLFYCNFGVGVGVCMGRVDVARHFVGFMCPRDYTKIVSFGEEF